MWRESDAEGFTLVELLIVVVVLGILASVAVPQFSDAKDASYDAAAKTDLRNLATAAEQHFHQEGRYPKESAKPGDPGKKVDFHPSDGVAWSIARHPASQESGFTAAAWHRESTKCWEIGVNASGTDPTVHLGVDGQTKRPKNGEC